jgi:hypothetical protein|tara:strand:- start:13149 stop:13328 length:180 start_codon:yes stop_codon:yes gene_type:complete
MATKQGTVATTGGTEVGIQRFKPRLGLNVDEGFSAARQEETAMPLLLTRGGRGFLEAAW